MTEDYLIAIKQQGFDMPWECDDPDDQKPIAECIKGIQDEFVGFLEFWRERILQTLEKQRPQAESA